MKFARSVLDVIGNTPTVELSRLVAGTGGRIFAKLEFLSPGGSKKDRVARHVLLQARLSGELTPGQPVLELTSGNMGTGAAIACAILGHRFIAVMSAGNSPERVQMMRAFGGQVVLVPQAPNGLRGKVTGADLERVAERAEQLTRTLGAFRIDQFARPSAAETYQLETGPELWEACGSQLTAFCDFVGSAGSFVGVSKALKARSPTIRTYIVEPAGAAILSGQAVTEPAHIIQGGGYAMTDLPLLTGTLASGFVQVTAAEAIATMRRLAREEGLFVGPSSGANVAAALKLLEEDESGGAIAVLLSDSGTKYFSAGLWDSS